MFSKPKFAIGDRVEKAADDHEDGVVVAAFPTDDGNFRYLVDIVCDGRSLMPRAYTCSNKGQNLAGIVSGLLARRKDVDS
jgi:hypothetical protein